MVGVTLEPSDIEDIIQIKTEVFNEGLRDIISFEDIPGRKNNFYSILLDKRTIGLVNFQQESDYGYAELYVCPRYRLKWATKTLLKTFLKIAFQDLSLSSVVIVTQNPKVGAIAAKLNFIPFEARKDNGVYFVLYKQHIPKKYLDEQFR